jgi:hypothetical protein
MIASTAFSPTPRTAIRPKRITPTFFGFPLAAFFRLPPSSSSAASTYTGVKSLSEMFTSGGRTRIPFAPSGSVIRRHSSMYSTTLSVLPISNVSSAAMYSTGWYAFMYAVWKATMA